MRRKGKPASTNAIPWKEFLTVLGSLVAAYFAYLGVRYSTDRPIQVTQTAQAAQARLTASALISILPTPTASTTPPPTENPTPTITPTVGLSQAALVLENYFNSLNANKMKSAWELLTPKLQCASSDHCDLSSYAAWWSNWRVAYQLYDCGGDAIEVALMYTPRTSKSPATPVGPDYVLYQVVEYGGQMRINAGTIEAGHNPQCQLVPPAF